MQRTQSGLNKSLEFYQKAIKKDPEFALAYTGSSITYVYLGWMNYVPPKIAYQKAKDQALKALDIDDSIGESHSAMAWVLDLYDWDWAGAKSEFERAIAINASDAETHHKYSHLLAEMGWFDESIEAMERALELEPIAVDILACAGMNLYFARRYDEAIDQLNKTIELDPNFYDPYGWLGITYSQIGKYQQAIEIFQKAQAFPEINTRMIATQAYTYALAGQKDEAQKRLDQLIEISKKESVEPYFIAWVYVGLGEKDRAMDYLEMAFDTRSGFMRMFVKIDPWLDTLRREPSFTELLKKMGFA
jgi:tetratricopeptide (TPR) repeat protein